MKLILNGYNSGWLSLHSDFWICCKRNHDSAMLQSSDMNHRWLLGKKLTSIWKVTVGLRLWNFNKNHKWFLFPLEHSSTTNPTFLCCRWTISLTKEFCLMRRNIFAHSKCYILKHQFIAVRETIRLEGIEDLQMFLVTLCRSNDCTM